ncbi:MAG: YifB family Mg chelatase-like AAA ATPase [Spirochaetaceae bacterium]|nr:YifB family Mg chelatase-like AAA ATPase [Spirochaetaceae bacterium]
MEIFSFSPFGYEGLLVTVEVDLRRGIPAVDLVGLADNAVKESRERMRSAIRNSGFDFPLERILISLSPADIRKEGSGFDLAIALAVLGEKNKEVVPRLREKGRVLVMGELELSGNVRGVRGVHAAVSTALEKGFSFCIIPKENQQEVSEIGQDASGNTEIKIFPVSSLEEAFEVISTLPEEFFCTKEEKRKASFPEKIEFDEVFADSDLSVVKKQNVLLRGMELAAAGGHNLLAYGPPGCGKTLALQRFSSIIPLLNREEGRSVTRIYSLAGLIPAGGKALKTAPFRQPHQSSSLEGMIGGGPQCRPGEISLAHNGVLFLDEASEFKPSVLQSLRIPLETGSIFLSRAGRHTTFPARFQLLLATNPCPCGNLGSSEHICTCPPQNVQRFWRKFSAPFLDRIDLRIPVYENFRLEMESFICDDSFLEKERFSSAEIQKKVEKARRIQFQRQNCLNSHLLPEQMEKICSLTDRIKTLLMEEGEKNNFSKRGIESCVKIARTIADLDESAEIRENHMEEAIIFRKNCGFEF